MMQISTRGRYATRIMVALALSDTGRPAKKRELAAQEGMSADYAEQILMRLKSRGLVSSHRGAGGGYALARSADAITVADVLEATEGPIAVTPCAEEPCDRAPECVTRRVWRRAEEVLVGVFGTVTIGQLAREAAQLRTRKAHAYVI